MPAANIAPVDLEHGPCDGGKIVVPVPIPDHVYTRRRPFPHDLFQPYRLEPSELFSTWYLYEQGKYRFLDYLTADQFEEHKEGKAK